MLGVLHAHRNLNSRLILDGANSNAWLQVMYSEKRSTTPESHILVVELPVLQPSLVVSG